MIVVLPNKRYFKIGEISRLLNLETHVLRYWEKEFPLLKPEKSTSKHRLYNQNDIEIIAVIFHLVRLKNYRVAGARDLMKSWKDEGILKEIQKKLVTRSRPGQIPISHDKNHALFGSPAQIGLQNTHIDIEELAILFRNQSPNSDNNTNTTTKQLQTKYDNQAALRELKQNIEQLTQKCQAYENKIQNLNAQNDDLLQKNKLLLQSHNTYENTQKQFNAEKSRLQMIVNALQNDANTARERYAHAENQLQQAQNEIANLEEQLEKHHRLNYPEQIHHLQQSLIHLKHESQQQKLDCQLKLSRYQNLQHQLINHTNAIRSHLNNDENIGDI